MSGDRAPAGGSRFAFSLILILVFYIFIEVCLFIVLGFMPPNYTFSAYTKPCEKFDPASMLINYAGPAFSFTYYSFDNILDDQDFDLRIDYDMNTFDDPGDSSLGLPPGLKYSDVFKDKIVLIGSSMHELHDNFPTPFLEHRNREGLDESGMYLVAQLDRAQIDVIGRLQGERRLRPFRVTMRVCASTASTAATTSTVSVCSQRAFLPGRRGRHPAYRHAPAPKKRLAPPRRQSPRNTPSVLCRPC